MEIQPSSPIQIPTSEEVRKINDEGVRIMSITMPYALKQMQAMYQRTPDQTHARFVHYTTAEAALNIIRTKRFWLRNTTACPTTAKCSTASISSIATCWTPPSARRSSMPSTLVHQEFRTTRRVHCLQQLVASPAAKYLPRLRLGTPRLRGRAWATLDVASLRRNGHARRHRAPFPVRLDFRSVVHSAAKPCSVPQGEPKVWEKEQSIARHSHSLEIGFFLAMHSGARSHWARQNRCHRSLVHTTRLLAFLSQPLASKTSDALCHKKRHTVGRKLAGEAKALSFA